MLSDFVQIISDNPNLIIITCLIAMVYAAYLEWNSIKKNAFKDYKPVIISIGILGTFIGIFCGLWNFNTENITASVPLLLDGLKLAFITSILGMGVSIVMSFIENSKKELSDNNSNEHLKMRVLRDILTEQKEANKKTSLIHESISRSEENINKHFSMTNESLKKALDTLFKGATEEIITALERVISDFNKNLTEQFGDNFKQLNESVKKMIIWQENYKVAIEQIEQNLQVAVINIEKTSDYIQTFTNNYEKISAVSKDLHRIIETNQNQINNIEVHMNSLKKIGNEASLITTSIEEFSKSIQGSLSNQSEGLNKLSDKLTEHIDNTIKELGKSLGKSLGKLNENLTALTDKFRDDYESFLKAISNLIDKFRDDYESFLKKTSNKE